MTSGEVREYPRPATVAQVLEDASDGDWFLSDADEGPVLAVHDAGSRDFFLVPGTFQYLEVLNKG